MNVCVAGGTGSVMAAIGKQESRWQMQLGRTGQTHLCHKIIERSDATIQARKQEVLQDQSEVLL